jgi:GAF domain-containing protein
MGTVSAERLATIFVEAADTLVDHFDLLEFLNRLTDRTTSLVGAAATGLMLADERDRLEFVAASDENARLVELFQLQNDQGPCLDVFRTGEVVINVNLPGATDRWPLFAPRAAASGYRSVHAFPLRLRSQVIGALNVFGDKVGGDFDPADLRIIQSLADVATIALMQERTIRRGEELTEQLQGALNSRIVIEQAKGALAQMHGISVDEAFRVMRSYTRNNNLRLTEVAHRVVSDPASVPRLTRP